MPKFQIPYLVRVTWASELLVKEYMSNPAFAEDRIALQRQYEGAIKELATDFWKWNEELPNLTIKSLANELASFENLKSRVKNRSELAAYNAELEVLCQRHHLDYPWGANFLFHKHLFDALQLNQEQKLIWWSGTLGPVVGLPAYIMLPIPIAYVYLGTRKEIHKYINSQIDKLSKPSDWKDVPHALELHVKWLYANKVLGKSPKQIAQDFGLETGRYLEESHVRRAIRNLDRLLGAKPRSRGRPPKAKPD